MQQSITPSGSSPQDQILYAFSSVAFPLLHQIVLDDISVPEGYITLYRYESKIIEPNLLEIIETNLDELRGKQVLIVFIHNWHKNNNKNLVFYPLRGATIRDVRFESGVLFLYLTLGKYVVYPSGIQEAYQQVLAYDRAISGMTRPTKCPPACLFSRGPKISEIEFADGNANVQNNAWRNVVDALYNSVEWQSCIFLRIRGIKQLGLKKESLIPLEEIIPLGSGYKLSVGKNFRLEMILYYPSDFPNDDKEKVYLHANVDNDYFFTPSKPIDVSFRYDLKSIDLLAKPLQGDGWTRLWLELKSKLPNQPLPEKILAPRADFHIKLTVSKSRFTLFMLAFLLGVFITGLGGNLATLIGEKWSLWGNILTLFGSLLTAAMVTIYTRSLK